VTESGATGSGMTPGATPVAPDKVA
jgi:hypothetical protein